VPSSGVYIAQVVCSLREELNVAAFREAWNQVVSRHDILRAGFRWEALEEPQQDVYFDANLPFETQDWQHLPAATQQNKFEEFLELDRKKSFNLSEPPLMRLTLFRFGPANCRLVWTTHHIIISNRSNQVVLDEVFSIYDANCQGKEASLRQPRQYQDYIYWLQHQDTSKSENFWRNLLEGFNAATPIGSFRTVSYPDTKDREYSELDITISEPDTDSLRTLAQENQMTLNTFVQGAWALLLSRYSGEEDIVFGEVRANRQWGVKAEESAVGLFLNTIPLRIRVYPEKSLLPWLKEIRKLQISLREHENTPLVDIQRWSSVRRGMPLLENIYVFDYQDLNTYMKSKVDSWRNTGSRSIAGNIVDNEYPITLYVFGESSLKLKMAFNRHQFTDDTIKRMLGHLKNLLEGMAQNPNQSLATLPILTNAERQQILFDWNDTRVDYPQNKLIHQLFEAQAERTPDRAALVFEGEQLTYRELNQRANQLAHYLQSKGVGPDVLVGIAAERSLEMVVGLYGILKAGGAYVPIDPTYPAERVAYMLKDANITVLLTQAKLRDKLPTNNTTRIICLDTDWDDLMAGQSTENPVCHTSLENLAYTIYTSGSTGKPKGAMNTHGGILNRLLWMQDAYHLTASDRVLQKTPFSFDVSVWEFFWPMMFGARLVVARPEGHKDSDYLVKTIIEQQITTMHFVPSMLQIFLMAGDVEKCSSLRQVICSGEALPLDLQNRFFARSGAKLHNLYGPTEAAVDVTYWECQRESNLRTVPIGRPVANTQMYILDRNMQPVPTGVSGELYIGGVQVARGYVNRPDLTAEMFIPDPFSDNPKARLYKTGDLAHYLPDGSIEYLGRIDFQVKIRGLRVELGEIEAVLSQHPAVREAVVLLREDVPDDKRLVAYIVAKQDQKLSISELRDYLKQKLPDFMVPSHFITLDAFPLTPNQKVDRKALPAPDRVSIDSERVYAPPKSKLQQTIVNIWQEVLKVSRVGVNDNFFELGGHSLLIIRVYYRLREEINKGITITDMFRFPTISALTEYLSHGSGNGGKSTAPRSAERAMARRAAIVRRRQIKTESK
jgi:amino acid adenylation domain-containing protein